MAAATRQRDCLDALTRFHEMAYPYLHDAVDAEESGRGADALRLYASGAQVLRAAVDLKRDYPPSEWRRAEDLYQRMCKNLVFVEERLATLQQQQPQPQPQPQPQAPAAGGAQPSMLGSMMGWFGASGGAPAPTPAVSAQRHQVPAQPAQPVQRAVRTQASPARAPRKAAAPAAAVKPAAKKPAHKGSHVESALQHQILDELVDDSVGVAFADVVGMDEAKKALYEMVIWPAQRPDLFTGLREPPRGLLLFGPPGNGKTMLAKAVATEAKCKFFNISAASLTSKNWGEAEKLVRALFDLATELQPSIVFIDEIDSIFTARSADEHEASRRLKTEFMVRMEGLSTASDSRVTVMGATNRPMDLDDAVMRRLARRIFIPLPDKAGRVAIIRHFMSKQANTLSERELSRLGDLTNRYSASDLRNLCKDAAYGPLRELGTGVASVASENLRPVGIEDFRSALQHIKPSVSPKTLRDLEQWNAQFGVVGM